MVDACRSPGHQIQVTSCKLPSQSQPPATSAEALVVGACLRAPPRREKNEKKNSTVKPKKKKKMFSSGRCSGRQCSTTTLLTIVVLGVIHLLAFLALHNLQYSWWFDFDAYKLRLDSEYHRELALSDAAIERTLRLEPASVHTNASLCIAVATMRREGTHYVRVLLGSFLRGTPKSQRADTIVHLVVTGSAAHPDADQLARLPGVQIQRLFPTINATDLEHSVWIEFQLRSILFTMQVCLDHAKRVGAPYFVVLEDDGILADNFVDRVHDAVGTLDVDDPNWFVVKLFLSDFFAGFELHDLVWILPLCLFTPLCVFALSRYLLHLTVLRGRIAAAAVFVALVCVIGVGRQNLLGWRHGLTPVSVHFSMCAHVYSTRHAERFIDAATPRHGLFPDLPPDVALNEFVHTWRLNMYNYVPNLYQHIGFWSSCSHGSCANHGKIQGDPRTMKQSSTFQRAAFNT